MQALIGSLNTIMTKVGSIPKSGTNKFHNYSFATSSDILHKLQPLMAQEGLVIIQTEKAVQYINESGVDVAVAVTYEFNVFHRSGESFPSPIIRTGLSSLRNSKGGLDDKAINKCITSARKHFLLNLFDIPTGDYDDLENHEDAKPATPRQETPRPTSRTTSSNPHADAAARIAKMAIDAGVTASALKAACEEEGLPVSSKDFSSSNQVDLFTDLVRRLAGVEAAQSV